MTGDPSLTGKEVVLPTSFASIALCPIAVFFLAEGILAVLAHNAVPFSPDILAAVRFSEPGEAAARLNMLGLILLVLLGAAGMVLKTAFDFFTYFSGPARTTLVLTCGIALIVGAAFLVLMNWYHFVQPTGRLGDALFDLLFKGVNVIETPGLWSRETYEILVDATHLAVVLAIAAMITGSVSCLAKFPDLGEKDNWKVQSARLKIYATISAAFLIVSVLYFKSWAIYPGFLLAADATKAAHAQYAALANAYTAFTGIEYSLVLAAYALPVSYFQSRQAALIARKEIAASRAAETITPEPEIAMQVKSFRRREGLETTPPEMFKLILAIMSPLITGAVANLSTVLA